MNWLVWWAVIVGTIGIVIGLQLDDGGSVEINWSQVGKNWSTDTQDPTMADATLESPLIRLVEWSTRMR